LLSPVAIFSPPAIANMRVLHERAQHSRAIMEFKYVTYKLVIAGSVATAVQLVAAYESCLLRS